MAQTNDILNHMLTGARITSLDAIKLFGCTRLSGRVYDIEKMGYKVERRMIDVPTRNGKTTKVCEYWIEPKPKPKEKVGADFFGSLPLFI